MRLSTVFELLLIFLIIAFAAYGRVIDRNEVSTFRRVIRAANRFKQTSMGVEVMSLKQAAEDVNKYCTCNANICNCCRNFNIPIVQLKGPGCASLQYLEQDKLAVQLSIGDNILTSTVVNGQKPKAVCFPMPGGLTKFCGRIYSIQREADNHFKACLGLELQSSTELDAALRVSCFRFGPDGIKLRPAEQLPIVEANTPTEDDDDDDDIFGFGDDDDDDEDEDAPQGNAVPDSAATNNESEGDDDDDDDDVLGFGALLDILTGDDESNKKKKKPEATTAAPILPFTIPILTKPMVGLPIIENNGNSEILSNVKPVTMTPGNIGVSNIDTLLDNGIPTAEALSNSDKFEESTSTELTDVFNIGEVSTATDTSVSEESFTETSISDDIIANDSVNKEVYIAKPDKQSSFKKVSTAIKNKPSLTSSSINAIKNERKKPSVVHKPIKPHPAQTYVAIEDNGSNEDDEEPDDDDLFETSDFDDDDDDDDEKFELEDDSNEDTDEDEDDDQKVDEEKLENIGANDDEDETDKVEEDHEEDDEGDLIDDDEEEDDALLSALVEGPKDNGKIKDKVMDNEAADYGLGLAELLARRRHMRSGRQSKVMRL